MTSAVGSDPRWYVVRTKPKQEARAESNLRAWTVETLMPQLRERRVDARGDAVPRVAPLFPRYLFARFDAASLLAKVRLTRGVQTVVGFGDRPTAVEDEIIALVRARIHEDGFVRIAEPQPGDLVRIAEGPLRSLVGVFEREMDGRDRVTVLLTTVGCQARVHVAKAFIRKASVASVA